MYDVKDPIDCVTMLMTLRTRYWKDALHTKINTQIIIMTWFKYFKNLYIYKSVINSQVLNLFKMYSENSNRY